MSDQHTRLAQMLTINCSDRDALNHLVEEHAPPPDTLTFVSQGTVLTPNRDYRSQYTPAMRAQAVVTIPGIGQTHVRLNAYFKELSLRTTTPGRSRRPRTHLSTPSSCARPSRVATARTSCWTSRTTTPW